MSILLYEKIKNVAKKKGISIYRIERDLGFSNGSISKWNTSTPSVVAVEKVSNYLETSIDFLISEGGENESNR